MDTLEKQLAEKESAMRELHEKLNDTKMKFRKKSEQCDSLAEEVNRLGTTSNVEQKNNIKLKLDAEKKIQNLTRDLQEKVKSERTLKDRCEIYKK